MEISTKGGAAMKKTYYKHESKSDGLILDVLRIEPDNPREIKGIVQLVHGMNEYKERYIPFMEYLAVNGYLTVIHDHRGHGQSIKSPDDLGYMYEGGYVALVKDTHDITKETKAYAKALTGRDLPFVLFGHSMGSMVVRCYLRKFDKDIDKLMVVGCPSEKAGMKIGIMLIRLMEKFKGERFRSKFISGLVMGAYEKRFAKEKLPHSWVNSDPEEVKKYNADPLCNFCFTLNAYENLVKLTMLTYKEGGFIPGNAELPIRFYSGLDDPCAISEKAFKKAMDYLKRQGYKHVAGKMYYGMRHEILNEPAKKRVLEEMLRFIEE